ncbi:MAG: polysaccharide deacetylase [Frondihabitans sp.]|nr:polysaccharide deacetylase [Frondihabitans sp.]
MLRPAVDDRLSARDEPRALAMSVVVPSYQRRLSVVRTVLALSKCTLPGPTEIIVCVDGSTDGSIDALRSIDLPLPLITIEQENRGASAARNAGARASRGRILLFLDDDMIVHENALVAHWRFQEENPGVALGDIPVHPDSPQTVITRSLTSWAKTRRERLASSAGPVEPADWLSGHFSIPSEVFFSVGGFDESLTDGGSFGGEDTDLLARVASRGIHIAFESEAIAWQWYDVSPKRNLQQWREAGRADATVVRRHPQIWSHLRSTHGATSPVGRAVVGALSSDMLRKNLLPPVRKSVLALSSAYPQRRWSQRAFLAWRQVEYLAGAAEAGGLRVEPRVAILAYHAVTDTPPRRLAQYTVSPAQFAAQLEQLVRAGFTILRPSEFTEYAAGAGSVPDRSVLLTFDDCYADLTDCVLPVLETYAASAVAFAPTAFIGKSNVWDQLSLDDHMPLASWGDLRQLEAVGWLIGSHSHTHAHLTQLTAGALERELRLSAVAFEDQGLRSPDMIAFPFGEHDAKVRTMARRLGYRSMFGLDPGFGSVLRRVEVRQQDDARQLVDRLNRSFVSRPHVTARTLRREAARYFPKGLHSLWRNPPEKIREAHS